MERICHQIRRTRSVRGDTESGRVECDNVDDVVAGFSMMQTFGASFAGAKRARRMTHKLKRKDNPDHQP